MVSPKKLVDVQPVYPERSIKGVVILETAVAADGSVTSARVLRSVPLLDEAALDAVRQWRYAPTCLNGVAVPIVMTAAVSFGTDSPERDLPERIKTVFPVYPAAALAAGVRGRIVVTLAVGGDGSVERITFAQSVRQLEQATHDAVMQWKYSPTYREGVAVPVTVTEVLVFDLAANERR